jgi:hydroxymethylglutaryl-CoA reductase
LDSFVVTSVPSRIPGFYQLTVEQRRQRLADIGALPPAAFATLNADALSQDAADGMIENVIGAYALPMAIALNFVIDGQPRLIPMCVEEASVVAAASNGAKMAAATGGFHTMATAPIMIGQVQLTQVADPAAATASIMSQRDSLLADMAAIIPRLVARGGGPRDISVRQLAAPGSVDGGMLVVHLHIDCRDAMGANLVNTVCEAMAPRLAQLAQAQVGLRILSNYSDERTMTVRCSVSDQAIGGDHIRRAVAAASRFAELDPYRATTHNKGIMNGVDAVLVATGQDWRAVSAGAHAFAARRGVYQPLAVWRDTGTELHGELIMPMAVGSVGGALHVHPGARTALRLGHVESATDLAALSCAAGLATNLAALRALATEGIQRGHMSLHARSIARAAGATGDEAIQLAAELSATGEVKLERAQQLLAQRQSRKEPT